MHENEKDLTYLMPWNSFNLSSRGSGPLPLGATKRAQLRRTENANKYGLPENKERISNYTWNFIYTLVKERELLDKRELLILIT